MRLFARVVAVIGMGLVFLLNAAPPDAVLINGAGATFPYPMYSKWFDEYHKLHPNIQMNYQSIGSGGASASSSPERLISAPPTGP